MATISIDSSATMSAVIPAVAGLRPFIIGYDLQGDTLDNELTFQNADDNSNICKVRVSASGGGASWQEQADTKGGKTGVAVNLVFGSANRVLGSLSYTYR